MHRLVHSSEEFKLPKIYSKEYAVQRPHQNKESRSSGKPKRGKSVDFNKNIQEIWTNMMILSKGRKREKNGY